jgi:hypothetical protein
VPKVPTPRLQSFVKISAHARVAPLDFIFSGILLQNAPAVHFLLDFGRTLAVQLSTGPTRKARKFLFSVRFVPVAPDSNLDFERHRQLGRLRHMAAQWIGHGRDSLVRHFEDEFVMHLHDEPRRYP